MTEATTTPAADETVVDKAETLSADVLSSVEDGTRAALKAVRQFLDTVDEAIPGDHPSRREAVIDSAMNMADSLVTTQYEFLRKVVHSAGSALGK